MVHWASAGPKLVILMPLEEIREAAIVGARNMTKHRRLLDVTNIVFQRGWRLCVTVDKSTAQGTMLQS